MKSILNTTIIRFSLALIFIVSPLIVRRAAPADTIPYADLVGVWTLSQGGPNHNLTKAQVSELCGVALSIIHPDRNMDNHIRIIGDGKLLTSMDILSKNPCTYADNQLTCEMEFTALGKSLGVQPGITHFQKVRDGVYDLTSFKPDGKTVHQVQTIYPCSMTIPEAQAGAAVSTRTRLRRRF